MHEAPFVSRLNEQATPVRCSSPVGSVMTTDEVDAHQSDVARVLSKRQ